MRYSLIISLISLFITNVCGQQVTPGDTLTREDYLLKSKKKETAAWTVLGIGTAAIAGGILISVGENDDINSVYTTTFTGIPLVLTGVLLDLISIPLFKSARKNKKRAGNPDASHGL